jgi:hypothetical protein
MVPVLVVFIGGRSGFVETIPHVTSRIFALVSAPANPVAVIPFAAWNAFTARSVAGPKLPLGCAWRYPEEISAFCKSVTLPAAEESLEP